MESKGKNKLIDIFEKYAPRWKFAVSEYARALWTNSKTLETDIEYDNNAIRFAKEYRNSLEKHYKKKGMNVYRGTLDGWVREWYDQQQALKSSLKEIAEEKQDKLVKDALERLNEQDTKDAQKVLDKLFDAKENETVYKVFSFKENFEDLAKQKGDDNAYDLGSGMNEKIIKHFSDRYFWRTQKDKRVRYTHFKLADKCFLFKDPPTTIDKYDNRHTGNPGTDYGCRCWAEVADKREKVLENYIVHEK